MFILSHLIAALASVLPLLLAIQKGRNGDFDYLYQRTIDYTSSFQVPSVFGFLLPTPNQDIVVPVVPLVNVTNVTTSQPVTSQTNTHLDEQPAYLNVTGEPSYTAPYSQSAFHTYRQAAFCVMDTWLGFSKYALLVFQGLVRMMEDLKDFSTELHLHHYDFSHASTPRTWKALVVAYISLLRSLVHIVLPLSLVLAMLVKHFAAALWLVSIGLGYYVYILLQTLAKETENLKQEEKTFMELVAHAETLRRDLAQQLLLLDEKEENLKLHETEESKLQAQADTLQNDLDQRTKLFTESQEELKRHERTAEQLREHAECLQQDLDARTKLLAEGQERLVQQETAAKVLQAHANTLQQDLEQQKQLLEDQRHTIEEFQASSKRQLRDSQAKIVSLEEAMQAQVQRHGEAQGKALMKAREEAQRLQAGKEALDIALTAERQQSCRALNRVKAMENKHTETSRRLNAVNILYENQNQTLKQKTAQIEELRSEREELAQTARAAGAAAPKLRDSLQKLEIDFANKVAAMTSLEQQLEETRAQLDQRAAGLEVSHSKNDELSQKLMEADSRSRSFENEVKRLENDLSRKSSAVEASEQQVEQLHRASDENALVTASLRAELAALRHEHTGARETEESLRKRTEGLENDLETKTSAIETLEAQAKQERRSAAQKIADLTTAESRVAALRQDNAMARARAEKLQEGVNRLEHELAARTSSVEAYERNSEHQEQALQQRNAELAQALELVRDLQGQLHTLRTEVETRAHDGNSEAQRPEVRAEWDDNLGLNAEPEAQRLAHEVDPAHHAPPAALASQEVAEGADEQNEAPARRRGHRQKRRRAGKRQAAKRQPIPRRHSFDSHARKSCSRCGGPLPVKVNCIPKELQQAIWKKPAETGTPVRSRRHSLGSPAHKPCPECGGALALEVDCVSEARGMQEDDRAGGSSTGELTRPEASQTTVSLGLRSSQSTEAANPGPTENTVASQLFPASSKTLEHDGLSEVDGAQGQVAGLSADTPSAGPPRRRRHRGKGRKAKDEQEQTGELNLQRDPTETQYVAQPPATPMLSSRWGPEGSTPPRPNSPPSASTLVSRWNSEGSMSPHQLSRPQPDFAARQSALFTPSPSTAFPPYRPPGQNVGFGYNFDQPRRTFSPSDRSFSPSGFAPSYNAGPTWAPGQRPPLFSPAANPTFPQSPFFNQGANRGQSTFQPGQPFNPSARDFLPAQPFPFTTLNNDTGRGASWGSVGLPHGNNVSKWAD